MNRCTAASAVLLNSLADRVKVRKSVGQPGRERESRMCEFPMGDCDVHANNAIEEDVQLIETWKVTLLRYKCRITDHFCLEKLVFYFIR